MATALNDAAQPSDRLDPRPGEGEGGQHEHHRAVEGHKQETRQDDPCEPAEVAEGSAQALRGAHQKLPHDGRTDDARQQQRGYGGDNAPYIWAKTPNRMLSWDFFDKLMREAHVVTTPGSGFGPSGEGFIRLSAFGRRESTERAMASIKAHLKL